MSLVAEWKAKDVETNGQGIVAVSVIEATTNRFVQTLVLSRNKMSRHEFILFVTLWLTF